MKRKFQRRLLLFLLLTQVCFLSFAHSGRTDSNGGHHDRKTGEYHYHNSGDNDDNTGLVVGLIILGVLIVGVIIKNAGEGDNKK